MFYKLLILVLVMFTLVILYNYQNKNNLVNITNREPYEYRIFTLVLHIHLKPSIKDIYDIIFNQ